MTAIETLQQHQQNYRDTRTKIDIALDECGIGHDLSERLRLGTEKIVQATQEFTKSAITQLHYDNLVNVPSNLTKRDAAAGSHAIRISFVSFAGRLVRWDINAAIELAADILDDVNAHSEADKVRAMATNESHLT